MNKAAIVILALLALNMTHCENPIDGDNQAQCALAEGCPAQEEWETASEEDTGSGLDERDTELEVDTVDGLDTASDDDFDTASEVDTGPGVDTEIALTPLTSDELDAALVNKDFIFISVHPQSDGYIAGTDEFFYYLDIDEIVAHIGTDPHVKVVVYCKSNGKASWTTAQLLSRGYSNIHYLIKGMDQWIADGYTLEGAP